MKHPSLLDFVGALDAWDKKHHLKGNTNTQKLCSQSIEAFKASKPAVTSAETFVDIGAGNGILGFPIFLEGLVKRLILVEPLSKRASFLYFFSSTMPNDYRERVLVLNERIEKVSRETIEAFGQNDLNSCVFCARAFSGNLGLSEAIEQSEFSDRKIYDFFHDKASMDTPFVLRHLKA